MIRASNLLPVCGCRVAKSCQVQDAGDVVRKAAVGVGASGVAKLQSTNGGEGRYVDFSVMCTNRKSAANLRPSIANPDQSQNSDEACDWRTFQGSNASEKPCQCLPVQWPVLER